MQLLQLQIFADLQNSIIVIKIQNQSRANFLFHVYDLIKEMVFKRRYANLVKSSPYMKKGMSKKVQS